MTVTTTVPSVEQRTCDLATVVGIVLSVDGLTTKEVE